MMVTKSQYEKPVRRDDQDIAIISKMWDDKKREDDRRDRKDAALVNQQFAAILQAQNPLNQKLPDVHPQEVNPSTSSSSGAHMLTGNTQPSFLEQAIAQERPGMPATTLSEMYTTSKGMPSLQEQMYSVSSERGTVQTLPVLN